MGCDNIVKDGLEPDPSGGADDLVRVVLEAKEAALVSKVMADGIHALVVTLR